MAVKVYDRDGKEWIYERGESVEFDDSCLVIFDSADNRIGAFNTPSWTHYAIPAPASTPLTPYWPPELVCNVPGIDADPEAKKPHKPR